MNKGYRRISPEIVPAATKSWPNCCPSNTDALPQRLLFFAIVSCTCQATGFEEAKMTKGIGENKRASTGPGIQCKCARQAHSRGWTGTKSPKEALIATKTLASSTCLFGRVRLEIQICANRRAQLVRASFCPTSSAASSCPDTRRPFTLFSGRGRGWQLQGPALCLTSFTASAAARFNTRHGYLCVAKE